MEGAGRAVLYVDWGRGRVWGRVDGRAGRHWNEAFDGMLGLARGSIYIIP